MLSGDAVSMLYCSLLYTPIALPQLTVCRSCIVRKWGEMELVLLGCSCSSNSESCVQQGIPEARKQRTSLHLQSSQSSTSSTSPSPSRVHLSGPVVDAGGAALDRGQATASEGSALSTASVDSRVPEPALNLTWHGSHNSSDHDDDLEEDSATREEVLLSSQIPV